MSSRASSERGEGGRWEERWNEYPARSHDDWDEQWDRQRHQRSFSDRGSFSDARGGHGVPNYSSRYESTSRFGGPFGSSYGSPYDDQNRFPGEPFGSRSSARQQRGPFAGRGPKGYARSDERIREDVCERLTYDPDVDASEVTVSVANGEVTLSGEVDNRHQKRLAEDLIADVNGVHDVHNRLSARRGVLGSMVDEVTGRGKDENNSGKGPRQAS